MVITARKRSFGQGNVFTPSCHSVHRGGSHWLPSMHHQSDDQGQSPLGGLHPRGSAFKEGLHPGGSA